MAAKEESEITTIKKACQVSVDIFSKYLKEQIMDIIDNDKVSLTLFASEDGGHSCSQILAESIFEVISHIFATLYQFTDSCRHESSILSHEGIF